MGDQTLEPVEDTIVCWFDPHGNPYAVFHRTDRYLMIGDVDRWYNVDQYAARDDSPVTWEDLLKEMDGFRGPVELISKGEVSGG